MPAILEVVKLTKKFDDNDYTLVLEEEALVGGKQQAHLPNAFEQLL